MSEVTCSGCGAVFSKNTAKFCGKCGLKRPHGTSSSSSTAPAVSSIPHPPPVPNHPSSATSSTLPPPSASDSPTVPSSSSSSKPPVHPTTASSSSNSSSTHRHSTAGLTNPSMLSETTSTLDMSPEEESKYNIGTLSPDGITPEMLETTNAAELRVWQKGSLLGRGTYGSVYLGLMPDGAFRAVKVVELGRKSAGSFNPKELVSLSREISLMRRLQHKNLCNFHGAFYNNDDTTICMFMEYVAGGSVSSIVKRFKPIPPKVVRNWTKQLLTGLLFLHGQRIIHRDIKGDNILIDTSASPESEAQVKLVDFGAAKRLTDSVAQSRTVVGTPYWMAPEIVDVTGEGEGYSYKADVWSVGCTVAEFLTGKPPWPSKANVPMAIMMIAQSVGGPTEIPEAEATPGCLDFMKKCFIRNPEDRPTVEDLLMHPWIKGEME